MIIEYDKIKLQPLRITSGWNVEFNGLYEISPDSKIKLKGAPSSLNIWDLFFIEDLLQIKNNELLIDVGWYPESDPEGKFRLLLLNSKKGKVDWDSPVYSLETKDRNELINAIEKILKDGKGFT